MWGMNVPVPFANNPWGFAIVLTVALGVSGAAAYLLWKRRMF
jgi:magnesium transporter